MVGDVTVFFKLTRRYQNFGVRASPIPDTIPHGNPVGIDIGLTNFIATSNGLLIKRTRFFALRRTQA